MRRRVTAALTLLVLTLPACETGSPDAGSTSGPAAPGGATAGRSVILVSGDGMAAAHREAGRLDQEGPGGRLAMDALPVSGRLTTDPAVSDVTDSAAAATAWATGQTTYNGAISVDLDGEPLPTLGAEVAAAGKATGLVTTAEVTDASPAAFFSNAEDRDEQESIARQYLEEGGPSVVLGGGADVWEDEGLTDRARDLGYEYVATAGGLASAADSDRLLGLFADEVLYDEDSPEVSLATMTATALQVLSADADGFFLFVEEEGVDSAGHDNDGGLLLESMRSLDDAVQVARDFVATHPDTLLVVTGDHETGGLTVDDGTPSTGGDDSSRGRGTGRGGEGPFPVAGSDDTFRLRWSTDGHTGEPVPVTAEGPGSEQLTGTHPNTHLHEVMRAALLG
ncbi:alkaline phosphatase [Geodermatophilus sabuli]|uniref:Alkaline phosphatase n=1 Tax=Geodermatophilus sabuli TaxID=1564158 RepID=A0A285EHR6_9ACTN|nr:alkaline phosphatase [Geodermatophilus sabuli]MBB3086614.1 alkaline phosphatase [Geodermatophilus sabuli]SNX97734.1 alkaline phosphatase [Geodermatophilus sabuli]